MFIPKLQFFMKKDKEPYFLPQIMCFHLQDVDSLIETACRWNWNSDYRPLRGGAFKSMACLVQIGSIQFTYESWSKAINLQGESPKGCLSFSIVDYGDRSTWWGQPLYLDAIAITNNYRGMDLVTPNPFAVWTASVPIENLEAIAQDYGYLLPDPLLKGKISQIHPPATTLASLRGYFQNLFALIEHTPEVATQPAMQSIVRQDFLPLLIEAIMLSEPHPVFSCSPRYNLVKQIEEITLTNPQQTLTLHDLCKIVHYSDRTLNYIFQSVVGMSPLAYLKAQRMNGAHRQFKDSTTKDTTVTEVAQQWGFWHMGHFSQEYKKMFGVCPSCTLKLKPLLVLTLPSVASLFQPSLWALLRAELMS